MVEHKPLLRFESDYRGAKFLLDTGYTYIGRAHGAGPHQYIKLARHEARERVFIDRG